MIQKCWNMKGQDIQTKKEGEQDGKQIIGEKYESPRL